MKIIKMKNDSLKLTDIKVFVCAPGLGKTYLSSNNTSYFDIDRARSMYKFGKDSTYTIEQHEQDKGTKRVPVKTKEEVLNYSINLIQDNIKTNKISLIAPNDDLVNAIYKLNIPYAIVFSDIKINQIIRQRMMDRGNNSNFIEEMCGTDMVDIYYNKDISDTRPNFKIIFDDNEYISDIEKYINY